MTRPQIARCSLLVALATAGLLWMNSLAPLQWPSVLAYSGIAAFFCGVLCLLLPPAWSGFSRRLHGLLWGVLAGAVLFAAAWFWPVRAWAVATPVSRLDAFMPTCDFHERHEILVNAPADRVRESLNHVSNGEIGAVQALGRIRAAAMGQFRAPNPSQPPSAASSMLATIKHPRSAFFPLDDTPREFVFGLAGQPWNNRSVRLRPEEFRAWAEPGHIKVAANFLVEEAGPGRSRLITETRVAAGDQAAPRAMARYWALVYPGSGMIRCSLLDAIRRRAERP